MVKKHASLEEVLLQKIKNGEGTFDGILDLKKEYNINIVEVSRTLEKLIKSNSVIQLENKFVIKEK